MSDHLSGAMGEALRLVRTGGLDAATRVLRQAPSGQVPVRAPAAAAAPDPAPSSARAALPAVARDLLGRLRGAGERQAEARAVAETGPCLVAYPALPSSANMSRCRNWFNPSDQRRDGGEPSLVAGTARAVMSAYAVDRGRVYVAGLSAGGAQAAIMGAAITEAAITGQACPDLCAAVGVHSGLACGAAHDLGSAFAAMSQGASTAAARAAPVPTIAFHGDRDTTVHVRNGEQVLAQAAATGLPLHRRAEQGLVPGGHRFTRTIHSDAAGRPTFEHWLVHGAGHAWARPADAISGEARNMRDGRGLGSADLQAG